MIEITDFNSFIYFHLSNKPEVTFTDFEKKIPPPQNCFFLNDTKTV